MSAESSDLTEWKEARKVLKAFDDRLDGIRRLGFSLVTALLTTDSLLLPGTVAGTAALPKPAKFAVLLATLLLLAAVEVIDRNYRVFQAAANLRAKVLEVRLNLELTSVIDRRYDEANVGRFVFAIYILMGIAVLVLGWLFFYPGWYLVVLLGVFGAWIVFTNLIQLDISDHNGIDWSLDGLCVTDDQPIHLTATNLRDGPKYWERLRRRDATARIEACQVVWRLETQGASLEDGPIYSEATKRSIEIPPGGNYTWELSLKSLPTSVPPGTYQLRCTKLSSDGTVALSRSPIPPKVLVFRGRASQT